MLVKVLPVVVIFLIKMAGALFESRVREQQRAESENPFEGKIDTDSGSWHISRPPRRARTSRATESRKCRPRTPERVSEAVDERLEQTAPRTELASPAGEQVPQEFTEPSVPVADEQSVEDLPTEAPAVEEPASPVSSYSVYTPTSLYRSGTSVLDDDEEEGAR